MNVRMVRISFLKMVVPVGSVGHETFGWIDIQVQVRIVTTQLDSMLHVVWQTLWSSYGEFSWHWREKASASRLWVIKVVLWGNKMSVRWVPPSSYLPNNIDIHSWFTQNCLYFIIRNTETLTTGFSLDMRNKRCPLNHFVSIRRETPQFQ
jgi:hypothetical protein